MIIKYIITTILIFLVFLIGYIYIITLKQRRESIKNINKKSCVFESSYGEIQYIIEGKGTPILILHGITGGVDQGLGLVDKYVNKKYKFIYVSRMGYLNSSIPENASVITQAKIYRELLDYLRIKKVFVLGNSAGGTSTIVFANEFLSYCRGLILLSSTYPFVKNPKPPLIVLKGIFGVDFIYWVFTSVFYKLLLSTFLPKEIIKKITKKEMKKIKNDVLIGSLPVSKRKKGIEFDMAVSNPYINDKYCKKLSLISPTLILHAKDDPSIPLELAREFSKKINKATTEWLSGGHLLLGCEDKVKKYIDSFIMKETS